MIPLPATVLAPPVAFEVLKHKPGRRTTWRATGGDGSATAILKVYASDRAAVVATRLAALAAGPRSLRIPHVLHVDAARHAVVLSEVPGRPLGQAVLAGDAGACQGAGRAVGSWHAWWQGRSPAPLRPHTSDRELAVLTERAASASEAIARAVHAAAPALAAPWPCPTVVHRDLYEEQVMLGPGPGDVGLIDLDDAALGPAELDVGNLVAHLQLLGRRRGVDVARPVAAFLAGHAETAGPPDAALLDRCRRLTLLRLACIHSEPALVDLA